MNAINERLKQLRKEKGETLKQVAKALNLSVSAYSNYEQGLRQPAFEVLIRICKYFDVTSDYVLGIGQYIEMR